MRLNFFRSNRKPADSPRVPISRLCTEEQLRSAEFQRWAIRLREPHMNLHRKLWEWCFITEVLASSGMLRPGRRGLGFAVGREPLVAHFSSMGVRILASDLDVDHAAVGGWVGSGEHATSLHSLNERHLCDDAEFDRLVEFQEVNMLEFDFPHLRDFDFIWSSCAFEHLGSIEAGLQYVVEAMKCLKPGGLAVHTTEFNIGSDSDTIAEGQTVIYRHRDIEWLLDQLRAAGHLVDIDWNRGTRPADYHVDVPPYTQDPHLKLHLGGYTTTSLGIAIRRGSTR